MFHSEPGSAKTSSIGNCHATHILPVDAPGHALHLVSNG